MRHHTLDALPQVTRIFHVLRRVQHQRIKGAGCVGCVLCTVHSLYSDKWMLDFSASLRTAGARRSHSLELVLYLSTVIMMSSPHLGNTTAGLFSGVLLHTSNTSTPLWLQKYVGLDLLYFDKANSEYFNTFSFAVNALS